MTHQFKIWNIGKFYSKYKLDKNNMRVSNIGQPDIQTKILEVGYLNLFICQEIPISLIKVI